MKIKINGIIETPKRDKPNEVYWKIQTNKGDMSAFDLPIVESLRDAWKNDAEINVDAATSKDQKYVNIRKLLPEGAEDKTLKIVDRENKVMYEEPIRKSVKGSAYEKDPVGLAVEVFNAIYNQTDYNGSVSQMKLAIDLVKQAQKAFE